MSRIDTKAQRTKRKNEKEREDLEDCYIDERNCKLDC